MISPSSSPFPLLLLSEHIAKSSQINWGQFNLVFWTTGYIPIPISGIISHSVFRIVLVFSDNFLWPFQYIIFRNSEGIRWFLRSPNMVYSISEKWLQKYIHSTLFFSQLAMGQILVDLIGSDNYGSLKRVQRTVDSPFFHFHCDYSNS